MYHPMWVQQTDSEIPQTVATAVHFGLLTSNKIIRGSLKTMTGADKQTKANSVSHPIWFLSNVIL